MKELVLDVETTGALTNKGHPFDERNKVVMLGLYSSPVDVQIINSNFRAPFPRMDVVQLLLIGFNLKFDIHWLRKIEYELPIDLRVWDCQLVHFVLNNQETPYPSLNDVSLYYDLGSKLDTVDRDYWAKGIDTDCIPRDILESYLRRDLELTWQIYQLQLEEVKERGIEPLISLLNQDLLVLEEMEWNGMLYDTKLSKEKGDNLALRLRDIDRRLSSFVGNIHINWNSNDHLSAFLYGGVVKEVVETPYEHTYKSGEKKGQTELKVKREIISHTLPRQFQPLKGTELKKDGYFSTDVETLMALKGTKVKNDIIQLLLERGKINKRIGTYYHGIPKRIKEMNWNDNVLHGNLNQCVTITGRLSSSKPNLQNIDGECLECFVSRF